MVVPGKKIVPSLNPQVQFTVKTQGLLFDFLVQMMPHKNRNNIKSLLHYQQVFVDGECATQFNRELNPGQTVMISGERKKKEDLPAGIKVLYEDDDIMVVDKPAGLLTIATEKEKRITLYSMLTGHVKSKDRNSRIFIVHRLDRDTSGVLVFARNEKTKRILQDTWDERVTKRSYVAVVEGNPEPTEGTIISYLVEDKNYRMHSVSHPGKGQKAVTRYSTLKRGKYFSLLQIDLETGRKNQIRVQLGEKGHPVVGDKKYGSTANPLKRMALHAESLYFVHPVLNRELQFKSHFPDAFNKIVL